MLIRLITRSALHLLLLAVAGAPAVAAEPAESEDAWRWSNVARVVAVGDVHGAYDELVGLLRDAHVIDADATWSGGTTHFVSLGDLLDRGPKSREVLDLLMRLQAEAARAGGAVHVVLGNHELMNLTGDLRYLVAADYAAFAADESAPMRAAAFDRYRAGAVAGQPSDALRAEFDARYPVGFFARQAAFAADGVYGRWLVEQPIVIVINGIAFLHAGLPTAIDNSSVAELNRQFRGGLSELLALRAQLAAQGYDAAVPRPDLQDIERRFTAAMAAPLFSANGPLWYRGTALCHGLVEQGLVDRGLAALGVAAVVIGHTPTADRRAQQRFDGKLVMLDTGMLESYYHGHPAALLIEAGRTAVVYAGRAGVAELEDADRLVASGGWSRDTLETFLAQAPIVESRPLTSANRGGQALQLRDAQRSAVATFVRGNPKQNAAEVAAYRIDALLGLGLVPVTVSRAVDGAAGVVASAPERVITEEERRRAQTVRPNWCEAGNDFQLMYVFDALIGNTARTAADVSYDRSTWDLQLAANSNAFPTTRTLPRPSNDSVAVVPNALAVRLAALDVERLQATLGELLNRRQIDALLARRDLILKSWKLAG
jgi:Calcineurin-like phosphoesterase